MVPFVVGSRTAVAGENVMVITKWQYVECNSQASRRLTRKLIAYHVRFETRDSETGEDSELTHLKNKVLRTLSSRSLRSQSQNQCDGDSH